MKKTLRAVLIMAVAASLLCVAALAAGTGISDLQAGEGVITAVKTADGTAVTAGEGGLYANAERFTVDYAGATAGQEYALFVIKGDDAPGDLNIYYVDQKTAGESGVSFEAFPKEMETGAYNVYVTGSGAPGINTPMATYNYTAAAAGGLAIGAEWVGQVNDTTHRVYVNVPGAAQVQIAVWADTECAAENDAAKQWLILDNDGTNDFIGDFTYAAHSNISGLYHATVYASPNGVDSWQILRNYDFTVTASSSSLSIAAEWVGQVNDTTHRVYVNVPGAAQVQIAVWADTECAADNDAAKQWLVLNNDGTNDFIGDFNYAAHSNISGLYHATIYASPNGVDGWQILKTYDFTVTASSGLSIAAEWVGQVDASMHRVYVNVPGAAQVQIAVWADTECAADNDAAKQWLVLNNGGTNDFIGDFTYAAHGNISGLYHATVYASPNGVDGWQVLKTYDFTVSAGAPAPTILAAWIGAIDGGATTHRVYLNVANAQQVQYAIWADGECDPANDAAKQWIVLNNDGTNDFIGDFAYAMHGNATGTYYVQAYALDGGGAYHLIYNTAFQVPGL